ncbi:hypothetical protein IGI80_002539 [Enterococcus sp. DIV1420a]
MLYDRIRPEFHLKRWQYYEKARYELKGIELESAKIFFNGLKNLSETDRKVLTDSYYRSKEYCSFNQQTGMYQSVRPISDSTIAEQYGITKKEVTKVRQQALEHLAQEMQKIIVTISTAFHLKIGKGLYLVRLMHEGTYKEQLVLGNKSEAKVFSDKNEDKIRALMQLGFEIEPVDHKVRLV